MELGDRVTRQDGVQLGQVQADAAGSVTREMEDFSATGYRQQVAARDLKIHADSWRSRRRVRLWMDLALGLRELWADPGKVSAHDRGLVSAGDDEGVRPGRDLSRRTRVVFVEVAEDDVPHVIPSPTQVPERRLDRACASRPTRVEQRDILRSAPDVAVQEVGAVSRDSESEEVGSDLEQLRQAV